MRNSGVLPLFFFGIASFVAGAGACGGQVEVISDAGGASSSSGSSGSSGFGSSGGTTSSGSSGVGSSGSSGFGSSTGSGSGGEQDSGFGFSSGVFDSGFPDVIVSADTSPPCTMGIPVLDPDGGMNVACESCLANNCASQECLCVTDPHTLPIDDAGDMAPGCDLYVNCVYGDLAQLLVTSDAGVASDLMTAISQCATTGGLPFPAASITEGDDLITCIAANCAAQCIP